MLATGTRFGPYEITGSIGAGGMGEVYRARDTALGREAALKVLPELFAADPDRRARFEREARTLASLNHPNIAQIYGLELGEADGRRVHALVMELVDGEDLSQRISRGPVPLDDALPMARQIADALEAAHDQGIVHRDLKPANVKVRADGVVKVLDFGLAKAAGPQSAAPGDLALAAPVTITAPAQTQLGAILGTAAYMAPEQARGKPADRRADIWAFGCVLFEMVSGTRPFDGEGISDVIAAVITQPAPLDRLPQHVPVEVRTLIARCLEKDPKLRLRDIGEARIALTRSFDHASVPPRAGLRRSPRAGRAMLVLTGVLIVALAVAVWVAKRAPALRPAGPLAAFDVVPPDGSELKVTFSPSVAVSSDGSRLAFVARTDGQTHLYVRPRDSVTARRLAGTEGANQPAFSPDGQWLAFIAGTSLKKVPLDGLVLPLASVNTGARGLTWLNQTTLVYAPAAAGGLMRISADGGDPVAVTVPDAAKGQRTHRWPSALPGGDTVIYTAGRTDRADNFAASNIEAVTLATGERRVVLERATMAQYVPSGHLLFMRGGTLHAVPFDAKQLVATGEAVAVVDEVMEAGTGAAHLSVGDDGTLAYILGTSLREPVRIAWLEGDSPQAIDLPPGQYGDLRISPDGTRIAFTQRRNGVWIYDLHRRSVTRLTQGNDVSPAWSADGKWVYYVGREPGGITILRKPADGSRDAEPMAALAGAAFLGEVIAGGTAAVINVSVRSDRTDPHSDVARVPLSAGQTGLLTPTNLEATAASEYSVDVSPDERWMAYQSNENGTRQEVYVRELAGARRRWQISVAGGEEPCWSPDGRRLYFRYDDALYAVAIDTRSGFTAGAPQLLFRGVYNTGNDGPSYTVDPKSGRLLMLRPALGYQRRHTIRMVLNWFGELAAKVPPPR